MPQTPHIERHFRASDTIRDIIIGMSDGLTVLCTGRRAVQRECRNGGRGYGWPRRNRGRLGFDGAGRLSGRAQ
jgi:hypothetical protein